MRSHLSALLALKVVHEALRRLLILTYLLLEELSAVSIPCACKHSYPPGNAC